MMNEKYNSPNSNCCGRPMRYAPEQKCKYNDCCINEYRYTMPACIRNKQPDCTAQAVIPSITIETADGITNLANCFVHVTSNNTTYYIDDKHRPMIIWAGTVEADLPSDITEDTFNEFILENRLGLRSQHILYKRVDEETGNNLIMDIYYDKTGKPYSFGVYEEIGESI